MRFMKNREVAILILNACSLPLAEKIRDHLREGAKVYALAGKIADYKDEFDKISDFAQGLYQQGHPIIALCASGIVIRALAPILEQSPYDLPVLSVAIDGSHVVPLLGVTSGANLLAQEIADLLQIKAAITTSGELRFGINLLIPPPDLELINGQIGKKIISKLIDGARIRLTGVPHHWLISSQLPIDNNGTLQIHVADEDEEIIPSSDKLIYRLKRKAKGRVTIIGLGPGKPCYRTASVAQALREADDIFGYGFYVDQAGPYHAGQNVHRSDNGQELDRAQAACHLASQGENVALVSSGDAGVFGMAAAFFETLEKTATGNFDIDIVVEPGITAALAASSRFGAPLGGDFAVISLSDNLKPQALIEQRLRSCVQADMAIALYNPVSKARPHQIKRAFAILSEERVPTTPVGLATDIGRDNEKMSLTTLAKVQLEEVTSRTLIIIGSTQSRIFEHNGKMWFYTPRHYIA